MAAEHRHDRHHLTLESGPEAAGQASLWVRTIAAEHAIPQEWIEGLDLCAVELVANITDYAYAHTCGLIRLELYISAHYVDLVLEDDGPAFDPLGHATPTQPGSLEEAAIGGLGIHLVRQYADACHYERADSANRLTVSFGDRSQLSRQADRRRNTATTPPFMRTDQTRVECDERHHVDRRAFGFISRTHLFRNVTYDNLEQVIALCRIVDFAKDDLILSAGETSNRVWILIEGKLRVHVENPQSEDFLVIPPGECIGEISATDGKLATAWVFAAEPAKLLEIDANIFLDRLLTIPQVGRNLITILAERMRQSNQRIIDRVRMEMELKAMQRELEFARRIQSSMLPANPLFADESRIDCHGYMRAARQVGGDFYDALKIDDDRYLFAIGDVCNKGMPAALFMSQTLALLRSLVPHGDEKPMADLVGLGNDELCRLNTEQLFVSLFLAIIDLGKDEIRFVNAGHNPPILQLPGQPQRFVDTPRNPVAGMVPGIRYQAGMLTFPRGSQLLLYTDGVTEAERAGGIQYGEEALVNMAAAEHATMEQLVEHIVAGVDDFAAGYPQADDITLLAVKRL